jgi:hypothetical protein
MRNTLFACSALVLLASWPAVAKANEVGKSSANKFSITASTGWCAGEEVRLRITLAADSPLAKSDKPWESVRLAPLLEKQCPTAKRAVFDVIDAAGVTKGVGVATAPSWAATKADDKTAAAATASAPPAAPPAAVVAPPSTPGAVIAAFRLDPTERQGPRRLGATVNASATPIRLQMGSSVVQYLGQPALQSPPWGHTIALQGDFNAPVTGTYLLVIETELMQRPECNAELYVGGKSLATNGPRVLGPSSRRADAAVPFVVGRNTVMVTLTCNASSPALAPDQIDAISAVTTTVQIMPPDGDLRPLRYSDLLVSQ